MKHFKFSFRLLAVVLAVTMGASMAQARKTIMIKYFVMNGEGHNGQVRYLTEGTKYSQGGYEDKMSDFPLPSRFEVYSGEHREVEGEKVYIVANYNIFHPCVFTYTCYEKEYYYNESVGAYRFTGRYDTFKTIMVFGSGEPATIDKGTYVLPGTFAEPGSILTTPYPVGVSLGDDDSADPTGGSITMVSAMDPDALTTMLAGGVASPAFLTGYTGIYFRLAASRGRVELDIKTPATTNWA